MTRLDRPLLQPAAPFHLGKQLAVQNRLRFHAPLRVSNGYQLHYRPLIGISGNGVDGVALGIAKMLDLPNNHNEISRATRDVPAGTLHSLCPRME